MPKRPASLNMEPFLNLSKRKCSYFVPKGSESDPKKLENHEFSVLDLDSKRNIVFLRGKKCVFKILSPIKKSLALNEIKILKEIEKHRLKYYSKLVAYYYDSLDNTYIFTELIEGCDLFQKLEENEDMRIKPKLACSFLYQLIKLIQNLFEIGILHGDIKIENIIVDKKNILHLIDFDLSNNGKKERVSGTPFYISPEVTEEKFNLYNMKSEIFSCGVVFFTMLFGFYPFQGKKYPDPFVEFGSTYLSKTLVKSRLFYSRRIINSEIINLVKSMINYEQSSRPDIKQIKKELTHINNKYKYSFI